MKSHTPIAVVTQISCAPMPFISGMVRFGSLVDHPLVLGDELVAR